MGLGYPGGIYIDKLAKQGDPSKYSLPKPRVEGSPYDFSFSGLKTAVINLIHNSEQKGEFINVADLAASFQKTVTEILIEKLMFAAQTLHYDKIALAGGVSANSELRNTLEKVCKKEEKPFMFRRSGGCGTMRP